MTTQIYNMAAGAASAVWLNPLTFIELIAVVFAIVTGLAGRLVIWWEDLRYTRFIGSNR